MIRQIAKRLNENETTDVAPNDSVNRNGHTPQLPLLLIETRPPDAGVFNRTDYYRTALKLLDEPFYERRMLIDIDTEQTWEKKGRGRSGKTAQFNDSPELRLALEEAMTKRGVRAVILDEAQQKNENWYWRKCRKAFRPVGMHCMKNHAYLRGWDSDAAVLLWRQALPPHLEASSKSWADRRLKAKRSHPLAAAQPGCNRYLPS